MNINGVSSHLNFGKTVRVNLNSDGAFKLANVINSSRVSAEDKSLQKDARAIFNDTNNGKAVACSPDNGETFYILSGKESVKLHDLRKRKIVALQSILDYYEDGPFLDSSIKYIEKREKSEVKKLISTTKESYLLSLYNDINTGVRRLHKISVIKK